MDQSYRAEPIVISLPASLLPFYFVCGDKPEQAEEKQMSGEDKVELETASQIHSGSRASHAYSAVALYLAFCLKSENTITSTQYYNYTQRTNLLGRV